MNKWLKQTIWYPGNRQVLWAILFIVVSCSGILLLLQPFGVNNYDPSESYSIELIAGVGSLAAVMLAVFSLNEFVLRPNVIRNFTIGKLIIWLTWSLVLGGSASYINYNFLGGWHDWSFYSYLDFVKNWVILLVLPIGLVILYFRQHTLGLKLQEAAVNSDGSEQLFIFTSANSKDKIALPIQNILFLEAQDNYVMLRFIDGDIPGRHLLRSTLSRMEQELSETPIMRCHRSYLVNPDNVSSFKGNNHRLELSFSKLDDRIPVSRKFTEAISARLTSDS